jgi:hypothetical protein
MDGALRTSGRLKKLEADGNVYGLELETITRNWDSETELRVGVSSLSLLLLFLVQEFMYI